MAINGFAHRMSKDEDEVSNANNQIEGVEKNEGGEVGMPVPVGGPNGSPAPDPGPAPSIEPEPPTVMKPLEFHIDRKRPTLDELRRGMRAAQDAGLPPGAALAKCLDMGAVYDGRVGKMPSFRRGMRDALAKGVPARDALAKSIDAIVQARARK